VAQKKVLGEEVQALGYLLSMEVYILGTSRKTDFTLPNDDDFHHEWKTEGTLVLSISLSTTLLLTFFKPQKSP